MVLSTNVCFFLKNEKVIHSYPQLNICIRGFSERFETVRLLGSAYFGKPCFGGGAAAFFYT